VLEHAQESQLADYPDSVRGVLHTQQSISQTDAGSETERYVCVYGGGHRKHAVDVLDGDLLLQPHGATATARTDVAVATLADGVRDIVLRLALGLGSEEVGGVDLLAAACQKNSLLGWLGAMDSSA
jgi:hypothetical protein